MKCTWIKRIRAETFNNTELLKCFVQYKDFDVQTIIRFKLDPKFITFNSPFYEQIYRYWYEIYSTEPQNVQEILRTELWHSKYILIDDKPAFFNTWCDYGIHFIGQIVDVNGRLFNKQQIEKKFNCILNHMDYNSITSAIPNSWKHRIKRNTQSSDEKDYSVRVHIQNAEKLLNELKCKDFYSEFVQKLYVKPKAESKWSEYLNVLSLDWKYHYKLPYLLCCETAIQSFQYKLLHRFYPCNHMLAVWFKDESELCDECNVETDTLEHFFHYCPDILNFWGELENWWYETFSITLRLTTVDIIFGLFNENKDKMLDIFNLCILWGKWCISLCKQKERNLSITDFLCFLKCKLETERVICTCNNTLKTFENRWSLLYDALCI